MRRILVTLLLAIVFVFVISVYKYAVFVDSFNRYVITSETNSSFRDARHRSNVSVTIAENQQNTSGAKDSYIFFNEKKQNFTCTSGIYILVLVHTATDNFDRRQFIRKTWGNCNTAQFAKFKVIFLLGNPQKQSLQPAIQRERDLYNDIAQGSFEDTYHNLTYKAIFGLKWALENCRLAKFLLKVDDDVIVNVNKLIQILSAKYSQVQRTIFCKVRHNGTTMILRRGKWKVGESYFPNLKHWPVTYCPGHFVIYTADIILDLYNAVKETPFLWLDDVYVTGLLAARAGNITHSRPEELINQVELVQNKNTARLYMAWNKRTDTRKNITKHL